jgi:hypothetical protein
MANVLLTIAMITNQVARVLRNNLAATRFVTLRYDDRFANSGGKIGQSLDIRLPAKHTVTPGTSWTPEDHVEEFATLTLQQAHVPMLFTTNDLLLDINSFSAQVIEPAIAPLANHVDQSVCDLSIGVSNQVGTPGTTPADTDLFLDGGVLLDFEGVPKGNMRAALVDPRAEAEVIKGSKGLFNAQASIARQFTDGRMSGPNLVSGFRWEMDQNMRVHTSGLYTTGSTPVTNGTQVEGAAVLASDGWVISTANVLRKGDRFTITGINGVRAQSLSDSGELRTFVVTADQTTDATALGPLSIPIFPSLITTGPRKTITALPADGVAINMLGPESATSIDNMVFHPEAIGAAFVDLPLPRGVHMASRVQDKEMGIAFTFVQDFRADTYDYISRVDVLWGVVLQRPEMACIVKG